MIAWAKILHLDELLASSVKPDAAGVRLTVEWFFEAPYLRDVVDVCTLTGRWAHVDDAIVGCGALEISTVDIEGEADAIVLRGYSALRFEGVWAAGWRKAVERDAGGGRF